MQQLLLGVATRQTMQIDFRIDAVMAFAQFFEHVFLQSRRQKRHAVFLKQCFQGFIDLVLQGIDLFQWFGAGNGTRFLVWTEVDGIGVDFSDLANRHSEQGRVIGRSVFFYHVSSGF